MTCVRGDATWFYVGDCCGCASCEDVCGDLCALVLNVGVTVLGVCDYVGNSCEYGG
jgi:hypothetical protein